MLRLQAGVFWTPVRLKEEELKGRIFCRHSKAYKNHVGLLSDCNRMKAESERKNSRGGGDMKEEDEGGEDAEEDV